MRVSLASVLSFLSILVTAATSDYSPPSSEAEWKLQFTNLTYGATVSFNGPSSFLANYSGIRLRTADGSIRACQSFSPSSAASSRSAQFSQLPRGRYCAQLACSCDHHVPCRRWPRRCRQYHPVQTGIDMDAWTVFVSAERLPGPDSGQNMELSFEQQGHRFETLIVHYVGCVSQAKSKRVAADGSLRLSAGCLPVQLQVEPDVWFCKSSSGSGGCRAVNHTVKSVKEDVKASAEAAGEQDAEAE